MRRSAKLLSFLLFPRHAAPSSPCLASFLFSVSSITLFSPPPLVLYLSSVRGYSPLLPLPPSFFHVPAVFNFASARFDYRSVSRLIPASFFTCGLIVWATRGPRSVEPFYTLGISEFGSSHVCIRRNLNLASVLSFTKLIKYPSISVVEN